MTFELAYFDPGAGSLLLQALVGGLGGLVVLGRYLWMQFLGSRPTPLMTSQPQDAQQGHRPHQPN